MEQHPDSPASAPAPAASPEAEPNPAAAPAPPGAAAQPATPPPAPPPPTCTEDEDELRVPPETYDPADYRWVPVRRRPRYDGWTEEKQRRFIEVLADTGLVGAAAKAVGMTRETAYRLRRSAHGAAFARAWDAARHHAAGLVEDIAFERAFEGVEHNVYDEYGEAVCTKRVYNDRLLMWLLSHLKPDRYGRGAPASPARAAEPLPPPELALEASLKALEPPLPAPPEDMLEPDVLAHELDLADAADGKLPHFLAEQRPAKSAAREAAEARAAEDARGEAAWKKSGRKEELSRQEFADMCRYLDPAQRGERSKKRYK
ncbi:MAG TPA: hypothetical protein VEZ70_11245 [Allosphingosinicella sp.]|nr:hypothetical protein [Allosphingosinicella sp.]